MKDLGQPMALELRLHVKITQQPFKAHCLLGLTRDSWISRSETQASVFGDM